MGLFQSLLLIGVTPKNALEEALLAFLKGKLSPEGFERSLLGARVFILLKEPPPPDGQMGGLKPLVMEGGAGPGLCVFTHQERSLALKNSAPDYKYGLELDVKALLSFLPEGLGLVFNAGSTFSTELPAAGVEALKRG
jgi:hypothetical protein